MKMKDLTEEQKQAVLLAGGVGALLFVGTRTLMDAFGSADGNGNGHSVPSTTGNPMIDSAIYFNPANPLGWSNRNLLPAVFWANRNVPGVKNLGDALGIGGFK